MMEYLSGDDIRALHEVALELYGGAAGKHEPGQIDFMADKPATEVFGEEAYPGLFFKAAVYFHGFATRQFFVDGNKRTAYLTCTVFLELNGYILVVEDDELYETTLDVANKKFTEKRLSAWLEQHACSISG